MTKGNSLAAIFAVVAVVGLAFAQATRFTNLDITGTLDVAGEATVPNLTISEAQGLKWDANFITVGTTVPSATKTLAFTSAWDLYVSTGAANANQWVKISDQ
jgi:hypothetical protein